MVEAKSAVIKEEKGQFEILDVLIDDPADNEVLIKVVGCGVCAGDVIVPEQIYPIPLPMVAGHEGSGIVSKIGKNVTSVSVGDPVVLSYGSCGKCPKCMAGDATYCDDYFPLNFLGERTNGESAYRSDQFGNHKWTLFSAIVFFDLCTCQRAEHYQGTKGISLEVGWSIGLRHTNRCRCGNECAKTQSWR